MRLIDMLRLHRTMLHVLLLSMHRTSHHARHLNPQHGPPHRTTCISLLRHRPHLTALAFRKTAHMHRSGFLSIMRLMPTLASSPKRLILFCLMLQNVRLATDTQTNLYLPDLATNCEGAQNGNDDIAELDFRGCGVSVGSGRAFR
jgi:hypothetical protein